MAAIERTKVLALWAGAVVAVGTLAGASRLGAQEAPQPVDASAVREAATASTVAELPEATATTVVVHTTPTTVAPTPDVVEPESTDVPEDRGDDVIVLPQTTIAPPADCPSHDEAAADLRATSDRDRDAYLALIEAEYAWEDGQIGTPEEIAQREAEWDAARADLQPHLAEWERCFPGETYPT